MNRFLRIAALTTIIHAASGSLAYSQDSSVAENPFHRETVGEGRRITATVIAGGILAGSLVRSYYDWWNISRTPFYFVHEGWFGDYSLGIDKVGHMYTSYFYFRMLRDIILWGGYTPQTAFWWAAGGAAFFAVSIEMGDGLTHGIGFSPEDLASNLTGLGYAILQSQVPWLQNIRLKWSYVPADGYRWPPRFTDHYDAHTYWLTFNLHNLLPAGLGERWPEFLQLAVGYGVSGNQTVRRGAIGLDFNLSAFQMHDDTALLVQRTIDMFHIPAPALEFTEQRSPQYLLFQTR